MGKKKSATRKKSIKAESGLQPVSRKTGGIGVISRDGLKIRCKFCVYFGKKNGHGWCSLKKKHRARNAGDGCDGFDPKK